MVRENCEARKIEKAVVEKISQEMIATNCVNISTVHGGLGSWKDE